MFRLLLRGALNNVKTLKKAAWLRNQLWNAGIGEIYVEGVNQGGQAAYVAL
jgi:hypothetical protein